MDMKKKINMPFYNWIQENYGKNENINPTKFGGEKYYVQFNSMNFNLIYEFESNPIIF
jgi:hypothetical protein